LSSPRANFPLSRPPVPRWLGSERSARAGRGLEIRHQPGRVRPHLAGRQQRSRLSSAWRSRARSAGPADRSGDTQIPRAGLWRSICCALRRGSRASEPRCCPCRSRMVAARRSPHKGLGNRSGSVSWKRRCDVQWHGRSLLPGDRCGTVLACARTTHSYSRRRRAPSAPPRTMTGSQTWPIAGPARWTAAPPFGCTSRARRPSRSRCGRAPQLMRRAI
jgi:hypothetical protein